MWASSSNPLDSSVSSSWGIIRFKVTATTPAARTANTVRWESEYNLLQLTWRAQDDGNWIKQPLQSFARIVHTIEKMCKYRRDKKVANSKRQSGSKDEPFSATEIIIWENSYPWNRDVCEKECRYTTQDRVRNSEEDTGNFTKYPK